MILHREVDLCDLSVTEHKIKVPLDHNRGRGRRFEVCATTAAATPRAVWMTSATDAELFREVRRMYRGDAPALERAWGVEGPFWARHYVFWAGASPCASYTSVFSPKLERFVGPQE